MICFFMIRQLARECYTKLKRFIFAPSKSGKAGFDTDSPGCYSPALAGGAEIKPVEPDQGNACAGKDGNDALSPTAFPSHF